MAQVIKRCDCPRDRWSKCPHSWTCRYWDNGKQREKSFKRNHSEAVKFSKQVEADKLSIHRGDPVPITFGEYAQTWLASGLLSASTVRIYGQAYRLHLVPRFGDQQLAAVGSDREGVGSFLRTLTPATAKRSYTALMAMLGEAVRAGRIDSYRLHALRLPDYEPQVKFTFPTAPKLRTLAGALPSAMEPAVWIMRGTGVRPGEVLALRKEDFHDGHLRVSRQRTAAGNAPLKARKQGEHRDVPVPSNVADLVAKLPAGDLFGTVTRRSFNNNFARAAREAGLPGFRPHDLRHTFASVALHAGVPLTDVARWLGHANVNLTYRTYSHFVPSSWDKARSALDAEYADWSAA
jgi:integrase